MSSESAPNKVLIAGAGPGGLALAQILRGQNIPFEIFERDPTLSSRSQGWAVALVECLPDLEALLPSDLGDLQAVSVNHGIVPFDSLGILNGATGEVLAKVGAVPHGTEGYVLRANREHFRQYLLKNLNVKLGKNVTHYSEDREGVTVFFADGTSARGSILVGADGSHSHIRKQLLGEKGAAMVPSVWIPIVNEMIMTREQYEPYHKLGSAALLANTEEIRFLIGMLEAFDGGERARYYSAISFRATDPVADAMWVQHASKQELYDKVLEITKDVQPWLQDFVKFGGVESTVSPGIKFEEFVPPAALPRGRVTLLGDSLHSMVPFRGAGANTAVSDACTMGKFLIEEKARGGEFDHHWVLKQYDSIALPRGEFRVLESRAAGESLMGPSLGRINRLEVAK